MGGNEETRGEEKIDPEMLQLTEEKSNDFSSEEEKVEEHFSKEEVNDITLLNLPVNL